MQSQSDRNNLIVSTAITVSSSNSIVAIGQDTDLLKLLLHHNSESRYDIFFLDTSVIDSDTCMSSIDALS